jgi:hypothetical protein
MEAEWCDVVISGGNRSDAEALLLKSIRSTPAMEENR